MGKTGLIYDITAIFIPINEKKVVLLDMACSFGFGFLAI